jgi:hypothetical protein
LFHRWSFILAKFWPDFEFLRRKQGGKYVILLGSMEKANVALEYQLL